MSKIPTEIGKYEKLQNTLDWIKNCPMEEFLRTFNDISNSGNPDCDGISLGEFIESFSDFDDFAHDEPNKITFNILTTDNFVFGLESVNQEQDYHNFIKIKSNHLKFNLDDYEYALAS